MGSETENLRGKQSKNSVHGDRVREDPEYDPEVSNSTCDYKRPKPKGKKNCGHPVGYKCCCFAHHGDWYDEGDYDTVSEMQKPIGIKLAEGFYLLRDKDF